MLIVLERAKIKISEGAQSAGTLEAESETVAMCHGFSFGAEVLQMDDMQNITGENRTRWLKYVTEMSMQASIPQPYYPTQSKSPLDRMLERLEWENDHCWIYRVLHWQEKPEY